MHPINDILGSKSARLEGKTVVLGITGSIAAVECVKLARELARHSAEVVPVMTTSAQNIIHPDSIHFATGHYPILHLDGSVKHVELCGDSKSRGDLLLIAPATANTISKIAQGIDDTTVTTMASCALGSGMPVVIVPAMHGSMYNHKILLENIKKLEKLGVVFISPRKEERKAKIAQIDEILSTAIKVAGPNDFKSKKVLVITGSTREPIDDVRYISNISSGRTGIEIAKAAYERGAEVEIWAGEDVNVPEHLSCRRFSSVHDLAKMANLAKANVIIVPTAISDFTIGKTKGKIPSGKPPTLKLKKTDKILNILRKNTKAKLIGFKAEVGISQKELEKRAKARMTESSLSLIVANLLSDVTPKTTKATIMPKKGKIQTFKGTKIQLADTILDGIMEL